MIGRLVTGGWCVWLLVAGSLWPALAGEAPGEFVEPEVTVLHSFTGAGSFGWAVSELADVDGDGAMEAMAGAPFDPAAGENAGRVAVYSGASGAPLFAWDGEPGAALGYALADAGDVDGDAVPDVIVGAPGFSGPGHAHVFSGADAELLHMFSGEADGDSLGSAVAGAGDVDGDGHADLLVGAETDPTGGMNAGRVYLYSGADYSPLWTREGDAVGGFFGSGTARLGDVDGDGVVDVVVGSRQAGPMMKGRVYVLSGVDGADVYAPREADPTGGNLGHFFVGGLGDLDGDGAPEVYGGDYGDGGRGPATGKAYVWSGATGERLYTFAGEQAGDGLGCGRGAGDADGDGVPDIATGSYSSSPNGVKSAGYITVWSGKTGDKIRTITGTTAGEQIGFDVVTLGDVDGDQRDDLVLSGANGNRVYIVAGALAGPADTTGGGSETGADPTTGAATTGASPTTGAGTTNAGTTGAGTTDASSGAGPMMREPDGGCGCRGAPGGAPWPLALALWRRRRRG
jgi:hypothetical protein